MVTDRDIARVEFYTLLDDSFDLAYRNEASKIPGLHEFVEQKTDDIVDMFTQTAIEAELEIDFTLLRKGFYRIFVDFSEETDDGFSTVSDETLVQTFFAMGDYLQDNAVLCHEWSLVAPMIKLLESQNGDSGFTHPDARFAFTWSALASADFARGMLEPSNSPETE